MNNLKTFYIQINSDNVITDSVQTQTEGYISHFADLLPIGVNGGWYKYINNEIVEIPELNPHTIENIIKEEIDKYTESLIVKGVL